MKNTKWVTIQEITEYSHIGWLRVLRNITEDKNPTDTLRIHEDKGTWKLQMEI